MRHSILAAAVLTALASVPALASPIPGLFNTGVVDSSNTLLAVGAKDTHYAFNVLSGTAPGTNGYGVVANPALYPMAQNDWVPNSGTSQWLTPNANQPTEDPVANGYYTWTLTFDLNGKVNPNSASFAAQWAADNVGYAVLNYNPDYSIKSQAISSTGTGTQAFGTWHDFSANSGFTSGLNTLTFFVTNLAQSSSNPTGLQVDFTSSSITPTPIPGAALLFISAAIAGGLVFGRKRKNAQGFMGAMAA